MKLKAAVVTPIPSARIRTVMRLNPGFFASPLAAYRTSCRSDVIVGRDVISAGWASQTKTASPWGLLGNAGWGT